MTLESKINAIIAEGNPVESRFGEDRSKVENWKWNCMPASAGSLKDIDYEAIDDLIEAGDYVEGLTSSSEYIRGYTGFLVRHKKRYGRRFQKKEAK